MNYWGEYMRTCSNAVGKKFTYICQCGYTSREFACGVSDEQKEQHSKYEKNPNLVRNSSINCPKHGDSMVFLGAKIKLPKKGTSKFRKFLKDFFGKK